jgi:IS30 family transposase
MLFNLNAPFQPTGDQPISASLKTLAGVIGKELAVNKKKAQELKVAFFYAYPNAALERGSIENIYGLISRYIPHECAFISIVETKVELVMDQLNNR